MGEQIEGQARIRQHDLLEEGIKVTLVIRKAADVAMVALLDQPGRAALAAQVEGRDPEALGGEIADRLEILFDAFAAPVQEDHRSMGDRCLRPEDGVTQPMAVVGLEKTFGAVLRRRIVWGRVKNLFHRQNVSSRERYTR